MATITTSEAFQWIFDKAESMKINRRPVVAQTAARDGTIRSTSRGGNVWRFTVKMPSGYRYSEYRDYLQALDSADRLSSGVIDLDNTGSDWLSTYQGTATGAQITNMTANITAETQLTISNISGISNGVTLFGQGDFIQLKSGANLRSSVYSVTQDVVKSASTAIVPVNRTLLNYTGNANVSYGVATGNDVRFTVLCTKMPAWTVTPNQLIDWDGEFEFVEDLFGPREAGNL